MPKELDADDGELTRTRKVRRRFVAERYESLIDALYSDKERFSMEVQVVFEDGRTGRITCSLFSTRLLSMSAKVIGEQGELRVLNPVAPHIYHRLKIVTADRSTVEHVSGEATYVHQLRAFADAVADGTALGCDASNSVANLAVIDAVYHAAGLKRRGERSAS